MGRTHKIQITNPLLMLVPNAPDKLFGVGDFRYPDPAVNGGRVRYFDALFQNFFYFLNDIARSKMSFD